MWSEWAWVSMTRSNGLPLLYGRFQDHFFHTGHPGVDDSKSIVLFDKVAIHYAKFC